MTKGIVLAAFGNFHYQYWAHNLAMSIKHHNPDLQIALIHDGTISYLGGRTMFFDKKIQIQPDDYKRDSKLEPGRLKCNLAKYMPYDHNLYLDVDALCFGDLEPVLDRFIEKPGYYYTHVTGKGKKDEEIDYSIWVTNEKLWKIFNLKDDQKAVAIQSSYAYFQKCKEAEPFYQAVSDNFEKFDKSELTYEWGKSIPDEVIYSGTISQMEVDVDGGTFIFFGNKASELSITTLQETYPIWAYYGNGSGNSLVKLRYWEVYDRKMHQYTKDYYKRTGVIIDHIYKAGLLKQNKHVNR